MKDTWKLKLRLWGVMVLMFGMVYVLIMLVTSLLGYSGSFSLYAIMGLLVIFLQYIFSPKIVEWSMHVKPLSKEEAPHIHEIVEELAMKANIPKPKIGISGIDIPNAFAYGRSQRSGHVCITNSLLGLLDRDELKAVLGHEIGHIKHNDMAITTIVSAIPMVCYYLALSTMFSRSNDNNSAWFIIGVLAFVAYLLGQLLVLFVSRIREYYADEASVEFGSRPHNLASALYKLSYGASRVSEQKIKDVEGTRALFLNDVNDAQNNIRSFKQLDSNNDGTISADELDRLKYTEIRVKGKDNLKELLSTHPDMLKRVKRLSKLA